MKNAYITFQNDKKSFMRCKYDSCCSKKNRRLIVLAILRQLMISTSSKVRHTETMFVPCFTQILTDYASFTRDLVQQFRQLQPPSSPQDLRVQNRAADLQTRFQQLQQSHQAGRTRTAAGNSKMGLEPLDVMR